MAAAINDAIAAVSLPAITPPADSVMDQSAITAGGT